MSTTTPLQIRNNPSNTSTAKHQWSFSKAGRFPSPKSKYFHSLSSVAVAHSMNIALACPKGEPPLVSAPEANSSMPTSKSQSQASTSSHLISTLRKIIEGLASLPTERI